MSRSEFAYFQSTDAGSSQCFGNLIPVSWYIQQCMDIFGPQFNASAIAYNVGWTNTFYGGLDLAGSKYVMAARYRNLCFIDGLAFEC